MILHFYQMILGILLFLLIFFSKWPQDLHLKMDLFLHSFHKLIFLMSTNQQLFHVLYLIIFLVLNIQVFHIKYKFYPLQLQQIRNLLILNIHHLQLKDFLVLNLYKLYFQNVNIQILKQLMHHKMLHVMYPVFLYFLNK